jgi:hypothetical protein
MMKAPGSRGGSQLRPTAPLPLPLPLLLLLTFKRRWTSQQQNYY